MLRLGENKTPTSQNVNEYLDQMEMMIYNLKSCNSKENINRFKTDLAFLNLTLLKLYNLTPFNSGEDLEEVLNQLVLTVDTSEESYTCTETHWNQLGIKTIKREVKLENDEVIYRCVCAEDASIEGQLFKAGQILPQRPEKSIKTKAVDFVALEGYFT